MNLKGMMVGNGCTNWDVDTNPALPETLYNFNIIKKGLMESYQKNDCHIYGDPTYGDGQPKAKCVAIFAEITNQMKNLNIYDLYRWVYPTSSVQRSNKIRAEGRMGTTVIGGEVKTYKRGMTMSEYTPWLKYKLFDNDTEPILGDYFTDYMNLASVRKAFNIPDSVQPWEQCSNAIDYHELDECS